MLLQCVLLFMLHNSLGHDCGPFKHCSYAECFVLVGCGELHLPFKFTTILFMPSQLSATQAAAVAACVGLWVVVSYVQGPWCCLSRGWLCVRWAKHCMYCVTCLLISCWSRSTAGVRWCIEHVTSECFPEVRIYNALLLDTVVSHNLAKPWALVT